MDPLQYLKSLYGGAVGKTTDILERLDPAGVRKGMASPVARPQSAPSLYDMAMGEMPARAAERREILGLSSPPMGRPGMPSGALQQVSNAGGAGPTSALAAMEGANGPGNRDAIVAQIVAKVKGGQMSQEEGVQLLRNLGVIQ